MNSPLTAEELNDLEATAGSFIYGRPKSNALHVVLGDGNLSDVHIVEAIRSAREQHDVMAAEFGEVLLGLSIDDRKRLYEALHA